MRGPRARHARPSPSGIHVLWSGRLFSCRALGTEKRVECKDEEGGVVSRHEGLPDRAGDAGQGGQSQGS
jgi:hypothetical protein